MDIERIIRLNALKEKFKSKTNPLNEFSINELKDLLNGKTIIKRSK